MSFLSSLMAITFLGIALPIWFFGGWGFLLLFGTSNREELATWKVAFALLFFGVVSWLSDFSWAFIFSWWTLVYFVVWFVIGALWFLFKWNKLAASAREDADRQIAGYRRNNNNKDMDEEGKRDIMLSYRPDLNKNKERALSWIVLWPFSMLSYLFGDLLKDLGNWIISQLRWVAERITSQHFGEFKGDENK